ncbi:MAG: signal peptidase II [Oscillospiraceae bacterium]|nr:signal peptidase II [Oscillospiraceae bacterium]
MIWLIAAVLIAAADQLVKYIVVSNAQVGEILTSVPGLDIMYVRNTGAAFSILSGKLSFLTLISIAFCVVVVIYWIKKKPQSVIMRAALTMMFSGALGNAIDRIARGFVVDFIRVTFINFPVFNIADMAITLGAAMLVIYVVFFDKEEKGEKCGK